MKRDLDTVNFNLTEGRHNKNIVVFSGMNPEEIEAAIEKIDFKQKFYEKPLYCKALKNITPVKNNPPAGDKNKQDDEEEEKNDQNEDLEDEMESGEGEAIIIKPKFIEENIKKKGRLGSNQSEKIDKYFTPTSCKTKPYQSEFGDAVANGLIPLDSPEQVVDSEVTDKRKAAESPGISPESKPLPKKDKRSSGIPKGPNPNKGSK